MTARLGQLTLIITILAVGYYFFTVAQGSVTVGQTLQTNTTLETGLILHYTFDGPDTDWASSTGEIVDTSGTGNTGNAASALTSASVRPGPVGQAIDLTDSANSDDISWKTASIPGFDFNGGTGSYSVAFWVNPLSFTNSGSYQDRVFQMHYCDGVQSMLIGIFSSTTAATQNISFQSVDDLGNAAYVTSVTKVPKYKWTHVVFVADRDNDLAYIYYNGAEDKQQSIATVTGDIDCSAPSSVAHLGAGTAVGHNFYGYMDDFRFYDRALSADEARQLYAMGGSKVGKTVTPSGLDSGLVGHWTFDGPDMDWSSTTAEVQDRSGQGNHGNAQGSMAATSSSIMGVLGQAVQFDGNDQYALVTDSASLDFGSGSFTISTWIYPLDATSGTYGFFKKGVGTFNSGGVGVECRTNIGGDTSFWLECARGNGTPGQSPNRVQLVLNKPQEDYLALWHHVVLVYDSTSETSTGYINGVAAATATSTGVYTDSYDLWLARGHDAYFQGRQDDTRTYNRALSADEVRQLYAMGGSKVGKTVTPSGLDSGLVGHWTFDGPQIDWSASSAEVKDSTSNGYDGDAMDTVVATSGPAFGVIGQAMEFDGLKGRIQNMTESAFPYTTGNEFSISLWLKPNTTEVTQGNLFSKPWNGSGEYNYRFYFNANGSIGLLLDGTGTAQVFATASGLVDTDWHHAVVTVDASKNVKMYVDASVEVDSAHTFTSMNPDGIDQNVSPVIGALYPYAAGWSGNANHVFDGTIDDVRVYDRVLSTAEITQLYNMGR